jgi:ribosomal protein S18 acetylase RimI-like enzyme
MGTVPSASASVSRAAHPRHIERIGRQFDLSDTDALVRMWRASFECGVGVADHDSLEEQAEFLRERLVPAYRLRRARKGSAIVGFLASSPESIGQLCVRVENIGQGMGTQLLNLAESESSGSLWLYTFQRNTRGCRFYERNGFTVAGRSFEPMWQLADVKYEWVKTDHDRPGSSGPPVT